MITRPPMKNQPSVTIVTPIAPYSCEARLNLSGRYSWLIACMPTRVDDTSAAPGSNAPRSGVFARQQRGEDEEGDEVDQQGDDERHAGDGDTQVRRGSG